jgi:hypothetical protein
VLDLTYVKKADDPPIFSSLFFGPDENFPAEYYHRNGNKLSQEAKMKNEP